MVRKAVEEVNYLFIYLFGGALVGGRVGSNNGVRVLHFLNFDNMIRNLNKNSILAADLK